MLWHKVFDLERPKTSVIAKRKFQDIENVSIFQEIV